MTDVINRRQALKRLGFGSLAIIGSGSLVATLQGCANNQNDSAERSFLSLSEIARLRTISEAILPRTQTPGAIDAGVAEHLSAALAISYRQREADYFIRGLTIFVESFERDSGRSIADADTNEVTDRINVYLQSYEDNPSRLEQFERDFEQNRNVNNAFLETYFVTNIIDATIWSYFTSELIGETVMRFDPVPGAYDACIDYNAGEHSWSS
jgi:hypothetical protein